jgi:cytochrome c553
MTTHLCVTHLGLLTRLLYNGVHYLSVIYTITRTPFTGLFMKRSYSLLLAGLAVVATVSGVAIAQQQKDMAKAAAPSKTDAIENAVALDTVAAVAMPPFDIKSVQGMEVGLERGRLIAVGVCAECHQADGNSTAPAWPKLAGQHEGYIAKQLYNFKAVEAGKNALRQNMVDVTDGKAKTSAMAAQITRLSADPKEFDKDVQSLAMWFASQKTKTPDIAKNSETSELGKKIYRGGIMSKGVPACAGCHGPTGQGMFNASRLGAATSAFPMVSGQFSDYNFAQLKAFREDVRGNSPIMSDIAKRMTDNEMMAVADYMSGVRVTREEAAAEMAAAKAKSAEPAKP